MYCPSCRVVHLVEIVLSLCERKVVMRSCSECGVAWSDQEGQPLALGGVLRLAAPGRT